MTFVKRSQVRPGHDVCKSEGGSSPAMAVVKRGRVRPVMTQPNEPIVDPLGAVAHFAIENVQREGELPELRVEPCEQHELIFGRHEAVVAFVVEQLFHRVVELPQNKVERFFADHRNPQCLAVERSPANAGDRGVYQPP